MSEWKKCTLGDICVEIAYGYTASAKLEAVGPKFLRITDVAPNMINWDDVPFCEADRETFEKYKLQNGDIVVARTGATTGYNKIIKNIGIDAVFASYLIRFRIDTARAYPYFVGYVLQSSYWYEYVNAIAGGSAQPGANAKQLGSFALLLPSLPEQRAIASILSSFDDKIDLLHRQNKTLEAIAETLFRQWFIEEAEEGWEKGRIGDLLTLQRGFDLPLQNRTDGHFPVVSASGISGRHFECKAKAPGVVTGRSGLLGSVFYVAEDYWPLNTALYIKEYKVATPLYSFFFLKKMDLGTFNAGSAVPTLNRNHIHDQETIIPPKDLIVKFEDFAKSFFMKMQKNTNQIRTLEKMRDTLLPKLMSGEVRVKV